MKNQIKDGTICFPRIDLNTQKSTSGGYYIEEVYCYGDYPDNYDDFYDWMNDTFGNEDNDYYGDVSGGGSNGGDGGQDSDHVIVKNLPDHIETQVGPMCVFYALQYVADFLGLNLDANTLINQYGQKFGYTLTGVPGENLRDFVDDNFNISDVDNATECKEALDKGHVVLSTIMENATDGHQVVIIGYDNETGQFLYADTQTGNVEQLGFNSFNWDYTYEIIGAANSGNSGSSGSSSGSSGYSYYGY